MFEWSNEYQVGVGIIDQQHKKLFSLLSELHQAATVGKGRHIVAKVLDGVVSYTVEHFRDEEKLMVSNGYPDYQLHKRMHDGLVAQAKELLDKSQQGSLTVTIDVMKFLESWINHHISESDRKLGRFLGNRGVK